MQLQERQEMPVNHDEALKLTQMLMRLFEHWQLNNEEQSKMLGLSPKTRTTISKYKNGSAAISFSRDTYDRVRLLLAIHKHLRMIFPKNQNLVYTWPKSRNAYFDFLTPIQVIEQEGFLGLARVYQYLENYVET